MRFSLLFSFSLLFLFPVNGNSAIRNVVEMNEVYSISQTKSEVRIKKKKGRLFQKIKNWVNRHFEKNNGTKNRGGTLKAFNILATILGLAFVLFYNAIYSTTLIFIFGSLGVLLSIIQLIWSYSTEEINGKWAWATLIFSLLSLYFGYLILYAFD